MRLFFSETRHPGLQFEHKNEAIPIKIESNMIFQSWRSEERRVGKEC